MLNEEDRHQQGERERGEVDEILSLKRNPEENNKKGMSGGFFQFKEAERKRKGKKEISFTGQEGATRERENQGPPISSIKDFHSSEYLDKKGMTCGGLFRRTRKRRREGRKIGYLSKRMFFLHREKRNGGADSYGKSIKRREGLSYSTCRESKKFLNYKEKGRKGKSCSLSPRAPTQPKKGGG